MKSKLWWISGYPDGDKWIIVPFEGERGVETITLDRQHLRRATYATTKLYGEFPRALPKLVGDPEVWFEMVRGFLTLLKPWIHKGESPPQNLFVTASYPKPIRDLATRIANEQPNLQRFLSALSWVLYTRRENAQRYLRWVSQNADALSLAMVSLPHDMGSVLGLQVSYLAATLGDRHVAPLVKLMGNPHVYEYPIRYEDSFWAHYKQVLSFHTPKPHLPTVLPEWTSWLLSNDPSTRRRFLRLLDLCDVSLLTESWALWWLKVTRKVEKARRILRGYSDVQIKRVKKEKKEYLSSIRSQLSELRRSSPGSLNIEAFTKALQELSRSSNQDCFEAVRRALPQISIQDEPALRA